MTAVNLELKEYQQASLNRFRSYLRDCNDDGCNVGFYKATSLPYREAPMIAQGTPYVCLRVPTGGGKTIMAAHSVGIAAQEYLQTANPMVLWLVPSTPILEQTVDALKNPEHPYRVALAKDFGRDVSILTKAEALTMSRADAEGGACIIVSTIQSFRREKPNGDEDTEGLKVYQDAGALMEHFSGLTETQEIGLEKVEGTNRAVASLANLLRLHRPMVIVDEAHNARTALSFDTLARFSPSLILELTATPQTDHNPAKDKHASNILYSVSAAELKAEQMIKMPIKLTTDKDWQKTIGAALDCQAALEEAAKAEEAQTGEYIRPLILFQAQSASANDPTRLTYDKIERFLIDDKSIPEEQIAVHSGPRKDLDEHDIPDRDCRVRYIITVQKLKEGWDCPFAYVLCSVAEQVSSTAIEQILGRVLRMPKASLKNRPALNQAYAYVASASFDSTAQKLKDGLVEGAGFNELEAANFIAPQGKMGFEEAAQEFQHESDPLPEDDMPAETVQEAIEKLPAAVKQRLTYNTESRSLGYKGPMTKESRNLIQLAFAKAPKAARIVERLYAQSNNFQTSAAEEDKPPFIVPLLGFRKQGELQLFSKEHFLDLPWRLDQCDASDIANRFKIVDESQSGQIDISDSGKVEINFARRVQGELAAVIQEPAWTLPRLANWIDMGIKHPDITKPSAVVFIRNALNKLMEGGTDLDILARNKYDLRKVMAGFISDLRSNRETDNYAALFAAHADQFAASAELSMIFDEQSYAFNQPYAGAIKFNKHYTQLIGDLKPEGEEFDCAVYLDRLDKVKYWIRNVENKKTSFWLQLPHGKFYPDFVAMMNDGRILVVEYKGDPFYTDAEPKRHIGDAWAEASSGHCLFCMPTERGFDLIDQVIA